MAEILSPDRRIVITGMGVVSPLGNGVEENWRSLLSGESGIVNLPEELQRDAYAGKVHTVALSSSFSYGYLEQVSGLTQRDVKRRHRCTQIGLAAASEALQQAGLAHPGSIQIVGSREFQRKVGVVVGSGASGADYFAESGRRLDQSKMTPLPIGMASLPEQPSTFIARATGARGFSVLNSGACETGNMSMIIAAEKILSRNSVVDAVLVGSTEAQCTPEAINIFAPMTALDPGEDPNETSRPFHIDRNGFVMAEGAGFFVIERLSSAIGRGASILAEMTGWGESNDANIDKETDPDPEGIKAAITQAISTTREAEGITYINAHATATRLGDPVEMGVIREMFDSDNTVVTSTKAQHGHLLGGANSVEAVLANKMMQEGLIPAQIKVDEQTLIPEAHGYVPADGKPVHTKIGRIIKNGFGFGGTNGVIVYQPYED